MAKLKPSNPIKTRYATKIVDNRFYGEIKFPTLSEQIIGLEKSLVQYKKLGNGGKNLTVNVLHQIIILRKNKIMNNHC